MAVIDPKWAWAPYQPSADNPWNLKKAGHLYRRAAFGATWTELQTAVADGPIKSVGSLLEGGPETPASAAANELVAVAARKNIALARAAYLNRMADGPHPLRDKITLFWHNHFATSFAKVQSASYMVGQYDLLTRYALGDFRAMLQGISKDPAMMVWLDTIQSKKGTPNENYARELMELFSLGIGNYTEADIREAARAFTGWEIRDGKYHFNSGEFDTGEKKVIGKSGNLKGEDIVEICLNHPACPRFISRKMFRYLVSETIPATPELIEPLAVIYRESNFDTGKLVETILRSNLFFSPQAYRSRVKSPIDFALGIVRGLELRVSMTALATALETMGQNLLHPPSVKGWDGGETWLNGQTLLYRQNLALALCTQDARYIRRPTPDSVADPADLLRKHGVSGDAAAVEFLVSLFLQGDVAGETRSRLVNYFKGARTQKPPVYWTADDTARHPARAVCHLVLTLPEFQLD
jgi:uncharacterized protein (DUF1800 family)